MLAFNGVPYADGRMAPKTDNDSTKNCVHGMLWHHPVTEGRARILPIGDIQVWSEQQSLEISIEMGAPQAWLRAIDQAYGRGPFPRICACQILV